jgi:hypothetical protein
LQGQKIDVDAYSAFEGVDTSGADLSGIMKGISGFTSELVELTVVVAERNISRLVVVGKSLHFIFETS